jgi:hypothetical protein
MKSMRIVCFSMLIFLVPGIVFAQIEKPCFAFLLRGDVSVSCGAAVTQVTRLGDVDEFAVSGEHSTLGYVTSEMTKRSGPSAVAISTTTLVDLRSGMTRRLVGDNFLVSTCGGLFWGYDAQRKNSGTRDLITGEELAVPAYPWFRCSSDRKVTVGTSGERGSDLYEANTSRTKIASAGSFSHGTFSISPNGSQIAYFSDGSPLCVVAPPAAPQCAAESAALPNAPSVDDSGQVLFTTSTSQECFYKAPSNFSPQRPAGTRGEGTDACLAISYWRPGLKSATVVESLGRNPQWISPATAELLRSWAAHPAGGNK